MCSCREYDILVFRTMTRGSGGPVSSLGSHIKKRKTQERRPTGVVCKRRGDLWSPWSIGAFIWVMIQYGIVCVVVMCCWIMGYWVMSYWGVGIWVKNVWVLVMGYEIIGLWVRDSREHTSCRKFGDG